MRNTFAEHLTKLNLEVKDLVLIYGDIGNKLFDKFKNDVDSKYINAGIAEASMVSMAGGLAKGGFRPIIYTINSFLYLKSIEQIKLDICYPNLPVILVGTGGGFAYSELGTTHHSLEDIGMLSTIPNLQVLNPADNVEMAACLIWAYNSNKPTYIRIGKKGEYQIHEKNLDYSKDYFGPFNIISKPKSHNAIFTTGTISKEVVSALREIKIDFDLWTFPQLKPMNSEIIEKIAKKYKRIYVIEEHTPYGGLGSAISYLLHNSNYNGIELIFFNTQDKFHTGAGKLEQVRKKLKLDRDAIKHRIESTLD